MGKSALGHFLYKNISEMRGRDAPCIPVPSNRLEEQKLCVELLDILDLTMQRKFY